MYSTAAFVLCIGIIQYLKICSPEVIPGNVHLRKLCVMLSIPGKMDGINLNTFKKNFNKQLDAAGKAIFGSISKEKMIETATSQCKNIFDTSGKCAYLRLYRIRDYLIEDVKALKYKMKSNTHDAPFMFTVLLSTWYLDKILLTLKCGPISDKNYFPLFQWNYFAKLSKRMSSKIEFCRWLLPLEKNVAKNMRREVKNICDLYKNEPICQLSLMFDAIDMLSILCSAEFSDVWKSSSIHFKNYRDAATMAFYVLRAHAPINLKERFNSNTKQDAVKESMVRIFTVIIRGFKEGDLNQTEKILKILPKSKHFPCDLTAEFPSMGWLNCAFSRTINQIRSFMINHWKSTTKSVNAVLPKGIVSNVDYRKYIKNIRDTNIRELVQKSSTDLAVVAADIKNSLQDRFKELGEYFRKVSLFDLTKRNADVVYIQGRIKLYRTALKKTASNVAEKITALLAINIAASYSDLHQAVLKLCMRMAMAANPIKWLTDSGNSDDILESGTEIAEATLKLMKALKKIFGFRKLQEYTTELSGKLKKNQGMITTIAEILEKAKSPDGNFEENKEKFLSSYANYDPAVRKDEIEKLKSFWDEFIDDLCSSVQDTNSIGAAVVKVISAATSGPTDRCVNAKMEAVAYVTCIEEIYDFQFELVEQIASVMQSINQMESTSILGAGAKAKIPNNTSVKDIEVMSKAISISYYIVQSINVFMLCNILEYERGGIRPGECNGLSSDLDKILSLRSPKCHEDYKYVSVPTIRRSDLSWLDISKLYSHELVQFQIPNSKWLVDNGWIEDSKRNFAFYVKEFEVFLPTIVKKNREVTVTVRPITTGRKLRDDTMTVYTLSHTHLLKTTYSTVGQKNCRQISLNNPYGMCQSERKKNPEICLHSMRAKSIQIKDRLFPSIYSTFHIEVKGYEDKYIDIPVTNIPVKIGINFCHIDPTNLFGSQKRDMKRSNKPETKLNTYCCPSVTTHMYYAEKEEKCKRCPPGSKSFYSGFFCGGVVKLMGTSNVNETFTYEKAVKTCTDVKSVIANANTLMESKRLGATESTCGWIDGKLIKAVNDECRDKSTKDVKYVYCKTNY